MNGSSDPLLHQVLAAPLAALVRAEAMSALALLDFITSVGMEPTATAESAAAGNLGALRMVSFNYQRQQADGTLRQQTMQVPLVALLQLPVLNVKDASFSFNVAMTAVRASTAQPEAVAPGLTRPSTLTEVDLHVALPPTAAASTPTLPVMSVQLNSVRGDFPNGIINLLQLVNTALVVEGAATRPTEQTDGK